MGICKNKYLHKDMNKYTLEAVTVLKSRQGVLRPAYPAGFYVGW
jgi:hypothetical protein